MTTHSLKKQFSYTIVLSTDHVTHCNDFVIMQLTHEYYNIFINGQLFPAVVILYMAKHFNRLVRMKTNIVVSFYAAKLRKIFVGKICRRIKDCTETFPLKSLLHPEHIASYLQKQVANNYIITIQADLSYMYVAR